MRAAAPVRTSAHHQKLVITATADASARISQLAYLPLPLTGARVAVTASVVHPFNEWARAAAVSAHLPPLRAISVQPQRQRGILSLVVASVL